MAARTDMAAQDAYGTNPESHALGGQDLIFFITLAAIV